MRKLLFTVLMFPISLFAATVTWTLPTTNIDGSDLTDLAGIEVCWEALNRPMSMDNCKTVAADVTTVDVDVDTSKIWYFSARAFDSSNNYSPWSNADFFPKGLNAAPSKPSGVSIQ